MKQIPMLRTYDYDIKGGSAPYSIYVWQSRVSLPAGGISDFISMRGYFMEGQIFLLCSPSYIPVVYLLMT